MEDDLKQDIEQALDFLFDKHLNELNAIVDRCELFMRFINDYYDHDDLYQFCELCGGCKIRRPYIIEGNCGHPCCGNFHHIVKLYFLTSQNAHLSNYNLDVICYVYCDATKVEEADMEY